MEMVSIESVEHKIWGAVNTVINENGELYKT